jgi:hypothetical protein
MSGYDLNKIRDKMNKMSNAGKKSGSGEQKERAKLTWWKPIIGATDIRFLPYDDGNGAPFQEVSYYTSKKLSENRVVAPFQWGQKDAIQDLLVKLRKNRADNETWKLMNQLKARESYYAPIVVRGQEEKGVQIWEMSQKVLNQIYAKLSSPDFADEYLFDPKEGYDFTITAIDSGREFNGFPIKDVTVDVRRKPSPLAKTQKERDDIINSIPNLREHFQSYTPGEERLNDMISNFLSGDSGSSEEGREVTGDDSEDERVTKATSQIEDAFDDL